MGANLNYAMPSRVDRVLTAAESGRLRVRTTRDQALLRRLDRLDRRISRPNWSLLVAALLLSGTMFYVNDEGDFSDGLLGAGWCVLLWTGDPA